MYEMENTLDGINVRGDNAEGKISKLEDRTLKIIQKETEGKIIK